MQQDLKTEATPVGNQPVSRRAKVKRPPNQRNLDNVTAEPTETKRHARPETGQPAERKAGRSRAAQNYKTDPPTSAQSLGLLRITAAARSNSDGNATPPASTRVQLFPHATWRISLLKLWNTIIAFGRGRGGRGHRARRQREIHRGTNAVDVLCSTRARRAIRKYFISVTRGHRSAHGSPRNKGCRIWFTVVHSSQNACFQSTSGKAQNRKKCLERYYNINIKYTCPQSGARGSTEGAPKAIST